MGQCTSRKATGSLTTKSTFVSHIKPFKMEKYNNFKSNNDDESRKTQGSTNENSQLLGTKKPHQKTKGVAMSFGFKKRPTPMTTKNVPIHRDFENTGTSTNDIDPNGNKDEISNFPTRNQSEKDRTMHKISSSQKPTSINLRQSRFGFHQATADRTNKVADIKTAPSPIEFGGAPQNGNRSRLTSPTTETDMPIDKRTATFTRNQPKKGTAERMTSPNTEHVMSNNDRRTEFFTRNTGRRETEERLISPTTMSNNERRTEFFTRNTSGKRESVDRITSPTTEQIVSNNDRRSASASARTYSRNASRTEPVIKLTSPTEPFTSKDQRSKTFTRSVSRTETVGKLVSPTSDQNMSTNDRHSRAFVTNASKWECTEKRVAVVTDNSNSGRVNDRLRGEIHIEKCTLQTTRLPQPEPIRVIETKTAKTIANNNKRSARIRRQFEDTSIKVNEDSGFGSNASGCLGEKDPPKHFMYIDRPADNRIQHGLRSSVMENSDSFSETGTPPPLPDLPSVFRTYSPKSTNTENEFVYKDKHGGNRPFIKLGSQSTFLKTKMSETDSSPQSSSEPDWSNAGEAMAEDSSLSANPKQKTYDNKSFHNRGVSTCTTIAETALQTLAKPLISLELTPNLQVTQKISLLDEDPSFTAVAANNKTGHLLDEEILSPVESLLSCSETEEILKKKMTHSSSNSKDINEKLTPASPETPSNGTYSLSLSDDKDDFLDDEIADQPELVFEDNLNITDNVSFSYIPDTMSARIEDCMRNQRIKSFEIEASPLPSRRRRDFLRSMTETIDSLSPCGSIASDDLMMEYDISQSNDIDGCDRRSGSFSSLDDTLRFRFNSEDNTHLANKNLFKSSTLKPIINTKAEAPNYAKESPRSIRRIFPHQSSPEHTRSPKHNSFQQFVYNSMSMAYDPTSDCLTLTKANHSAIQQDIIGIKTMLLTLKRVLNESETRNLLNNDTHSNPCENDIIQNNNNNSEFKVELADLRRQVIFLQGQLEDKEQIVDNLQKQIDCLGNENRQVIAAPPLLLPLDMKNRCNAATQTERIRPISTGSLTLSSSMDDSGSLVRLLVK